MQRPGPRLETQPRQTPSSDISPEGLHQTSRSRSRVPRPSLAGHADSQESRASPRKPASRRSSLLQLLQDRELCAFTYTSLRLCAFIPVQLCMWEWAKMYTSTCCQEPHSATTSPCCQTREVPRGTWSLPPPPGGPAQRARRQRGKSKQVYCHPPTPLPTLQLRLPLATALTPHYGLL